MIYIFETEIVNSKPVKFSLQNIYGLGKYQTNFICKKLGFSKNYKVNNLSNEQIVKMIKTIESTNLKLTSELKKLQIFNLKLLVEIKSYKGLRRIRGLPVRGQRTHTNAKTVKSKRSKK